MKRVCVYCGSNDGSSRAYREAATDFGTLLARRGLAMVYGGGRVGLMGAVADAALAAGGHVTGVIPQALMDREVGHAGLSDLRVVGSMHERKLLMADLADAFVALPGGIGTLEEIVEVFTWSQLGLHAKPCGLLDVAGYWARFVGTLDGMVETGFLRPQHRKLLVVAADGEEMLARLEAWRPPSLEKWLDREEA